MDFKDKVKGVWEKTQDVAGNAYKTVAEKSNKMVEEAKLKIKVNDTEAEIVATLQDIGIKIYEKYKSGEAVEKELVKDCKAIEKMYKEIEKMDTKSLYLKDLRVCDACHETIGIENKFCPNCGAKQKKVRVSEDKKEGIITEKECPECGTIHGADVKFCTNCGHKF